MSARTVLTALAALLAVTLLAAGCAGGTSGEASGTPSDSPQGTARPSAAGEGTGQSSGTAMATPTNPGPLSVTGVVVRDLTSPWGLDFLPNGAALITERDTKRVLLLTRHGVLRRAGTVQAAQPNGEGGLLGVAVSPGFRTNHAVFVYFTAGSQNVVKRFTLGRDGRIRNGKVILDGIPAAGFHNGGRMEFGPDGMLYVGTGDAGVGSRSQDRGSLGGKILRMTPGGKAPADNPFPGSLVYSMGHRNVQGLAFDKQGRLWASEFGQDTWDELNLIRPGQNYGWPEVEGLEDDARFVDPKEVWRPAAASPSGLAHVGNAAYMAGLRGERLWQIPTQATSTGDPKAFFVGRYGRLRTVVVAPDGSLWLVNSNTDGRGSPSAHDDRILRVKVP